MYKITVLKEASNSLEHLDKPIAIRIVRKLNWLAENAETLRHKRLSGNLSGLSKLREGDYRIIYQIIASENTIVIRFIGHRSEVYKSK